MAGFDRSLSVTYVLYAYNEEEYIRAAISSAFAQTYSPLEIVISDDGSTDRTYAIMEEMAAAYQGPHRIILNRNERNIGIGSQLNAAVAKTTGELIVLANGDDISAPDRVEKLVAAWQRSGQQAAAIASAYEIIEQDGTRSGRVVSARQDFSNIPRSTFLRFGGPIAAVLCVSHKCFDRFGPLAPNLILEDGPMNLRSTLTGDWCFIDEPLVFYRVHPDNISQAYHPSSFKDWRRRHRLKAQWQMREGEKAFVQMLSDLYSDGIEGYPPETIAKSRINAARRLLEYQLRSGYYSNQWPLSPWGWLRASVQLLSLVLKTMLKVWLPMLEARNDRWHYRSVMNADMSDSRQGRP